MTGIAALIGSSAGLLRAGFAFGATFISTGPVGCTSRYPWAITRAGAGRLFLFLRVELCATRDC